MYLVWPSVQVEENVEVQPVFAVCLQAELVPASVQDYRDKLLHLRKLRHDLVQRSLPKGLPDSFQQVQFWDLWILKFPFAAQTLL